MAETKWTPGPWSRSWIYGGMRHLNRNVDYDAFWYPDEGEDVEAANIPNVRSFPADADLIAAAPDLYAALAALSGFVDAADNEDCECSGCGRSQWLGDNHKPGCVVAAARAALAKARGES